MHRILLAATFASLSCQNQSQAPPGWGEVCPVPSGDGCDVGLSCFGRDDMPAAGPGVDMRGVCVEKCNDDDDCTAVDNFSWACLAVAGECKVACAANSDCPDNLDLPMVCDSGFGYCVIHRE